MMNHENNNSRQFDLGTVLTVTTHRLLTDMDNLYDILNYLTGENLFTHQLPRAGEVAANYVLTLYPQLNEVNIVDGQITSMEQAQSFVNEQKALYGDSLSLSPMTQGMYEAMDPIEEANKMRGM